MQKSVFEEYQKKQQKLSDFMENWEKYLEELETRKNCEANFNLIIFEYGVHKAGYINIIGNPNVGKSTLMNVLVGERLSIITSKAQTTRHRILGIVNEEDCQLIFSDTPGIIKPAYKLQENMMDFVHSAFQDADVLLYMVEIGEKRLKDEKLFERLQNTKTSLLLLINKIDTVDQEYVLEQMAYWKNNLPNATIFSIVCT